MRRRLRLDLAYDGSAYAGWQMQRGHPTVQATLEDVLARLNGERRAIVRGASRTDSGVHARQQVCDFELDTPLDDDALARTLGKMLPPDVRPLALRTVPDAFHSQYDATAKSYRYFLDRSRWGDPLVARYRLHWPHELDERVLREALAKLPGGRDWSGFTASRCRIEDRVRELTHATFEQHESTAWFSFRADGFLTYMVRNLVGTLLYVAQGRLAPDVVDAMLETGERGLGGPGAPPHGLHLWEVEYGRPLG